MHRRTDGEPVRATSSPHCETRCGAVLRPRLAPCSDGEFRKDLDKTWDVLMASVCRQEKKILEVRQQAGKFPLALTESHFTMKGRDRCDLNSAWAVGVAYARFMNLHQRHGDVLKITNLGDFCGTRWQYNVVMIPTPTGKSYLMPVGKVASLYRNHAGTHSARVNGVPPELDVVASRAGHLLRPCREHEPNEGAIVPDRRRGLDVEDGQGVRDLGDRLFFEYNLEKLVEFLQSGKYYGATWKPAELFEEVPQEELNKAMAKIENAPLKDKSAE